MGRLLSFPNHRLGFLSSTPKGDDGVKKSFKVLFIISLLYLVTMIPQDAFAMHIMEGFLPKGWAIGWWVVSIPFMAISINKLQKLLKEHPDKKLLVALAGAFVFLLSSLKIPSVTGSCSHPTGVGLGAILFGPWVMVILGVIVLLFQATLLAHGGLTTLGANAFSMAIVGPFVAYAVFKLLKKAKVNTFVSVGIAAAAADLITYVVTSIQLGVAFPADNMMVQIGKYMTIFAFTQVPIAIAEGILTALIFERIAHYEGEGNLIEKVY